jgi:hypothetical protein
MKRLQRSFINEYQCKFTSLGKVIAIYTWQIGTWAAFTRAACDLARLKAVLPYRTLI